MLGQSLRKVAALVVTSAALAFPAAAPAFTGVRSTGNTISVTADPGERNQVYIDYDLDLDGITVTDFGEGMIATPPCVLVAPVTGFCGISGVSRINVDLGNGNDVLVPGLRLLGLGLLAFNLKTRIDGGPGNDVLFGLLGPDTLIGGPGEDRITGFYGSDTMSGGGGDDLLEAGPSLLDGTNGRDRLFGGAGADKVRARDSTRDLRIDCGPDADRLSRDRFDPKPSRCP